MTGILSRDEAKLSLKEGRVPQLLPPVSAQLSESVQQIQAKLIESGLGMVVLLGQVEERVIGLVTLHDLLRAQAGMAKDDEQ